MGALDPGLRLEPCLSRVFRFSLNMKLLHLLGVALALTLASAQYEPDRCSRYQTTNNFTRDFIQKMRQTPGGYVIRFSNGAVDGCQRLKFIDSKDFNFTFLDINNNERNYSSRYIANTATPSSPATLELNLTPRLFGSDINGRLILHPLIARHDLLVFASCIERGLGIFMTEQVLVFTPFHPQRTLSGGEIMRVLREHKIPRLNELQGISTKCKAGAPASRNRVPLNIYNLISNMLNPFTGVADVALTYGAAGQNPNVVEQELKHLFRKYKVSPAQFYATTGSLILQNRQQQQFSGQQAFPNAFQQFAGAQYRPDFQQGQQQAVFHSHPVQGFNPNFANRHHHHPNPPFGSSSSNFNSFQSSPLSALLGFQPNEFRTNSRQAIDRHSAKFSADPGHFHTYETQPQGFQAV